MAGRTTLADLRVEWRDSYSTHDGVTLAGLPASRCEPTGEQRLGLAIITQLLCDLGYRDSHGHRITPVPFALAPRAEQKQRAKAAADVRAGHHRLALDLLALGGDGQRVVEAYLERLAFSTLH